MCHDKISFQNHHGLATALQQLWVFPGIRHTIVNAGITVLQCSAGVRAFTIRVLSNVYWWEVQPRPATKQADVRQHGARIVLRTSCLNSSACMEQEAARTASSKTPWKHTTTLFSLKEPDFGNSFNSITATKDIFKPEKRKKCSESFEFRAPVI